MGIFRRSTKKNETQGASDHQRLLVEKIEQARQIVWYDLDRTIIDVNTTFLDATGYTRNEIIGRKHADILSKEFVESGKYDAHWDQLANGAEPVDVSRRIGKSNESAWIRSSISTVTDAEGKPDRFIEFAMDITQEIQESAADRAKLDAVNSSQAVIVFDANGNIQEANQNFLDAMGYSAEEIVGQHHRLFVDPDTVNSSEYQKFWMDLGAGTAQTGEFQRKNKSGEDVWIRATYNPIFDPEGKPSQIVKVATDITAIKCAVTEVSECLMRLAQGDLTAEISDAVDGDFAALRDVYNNCVARFNQIMTEITSAGDRIAQEAAAMQQSAVTLSERTDVQAQALQHTASSMEEISRVVETNGETATRAQSVAADASGRAQSGADVVQAAVSAMDLIEASSGKVSDIVTVIESIAFQTNLLALNAAVEAARAGQSGKGFAVVAQEVRTLSQRASDAAQDITMLIKESVTHVNEGSQQVRQTGSALNEINSAIAVVVNAVKDISEGSASQTSGVNSVTTSLSEIDQTTYQNAQMAEASVKNASLLNDLAQQLSQLTSAFQMHKGGSSHIDHDVDSKTVPVTDALLNTDTSATAA